MEQGYYTYYKELEQLNRDFLDSLDLKDIYRYMNCKNVYGKNMRPYDLMKKIEQYVYIQSIPIPEQLQGEVFDVMNEEEFCEYMKNRYPEFSYYEVTTMYCEW